jgi:hypothetical protein
MDTKSTTQSSSCYYCSVCCRPFHSKQTYTQHLSGRKHSARKDRLTRESQGIFEDGERGAFEACPFCAEEEHPGLDHLEARHGLVVPFRHYVRH